jgi:hypothetical protein
MRGLMVGDQRSQDALLGRVAVLQALASQQAGVLSTQVQSANNSILYTTRPMQIGKPLVVAQICTIHLNNSLYGGA